MASRWWHGLIAAVILVSLVIQLVLIFTGGADANSGESGTAVGVGTRLWRLFSFFTIQSNLIVLAVAVALVLRPGRDGALWRVVRLDSLLGIVITGLVFAIVLAPQVHLTGAALAATIGFHYISPWTTLAAWVLLAPPPHHLAHRRLRLRLAARVARLYLRPGRLHQLVPVGGRIVLGARWAARTAVLGGGLHAVGWAVVGGDR